MIGTKDIEAVRREEPVKRLNIDLDPEVARDERDHLGQRASRVIDEILGDGSSVLGV
jgi:RecA-family ATPase